MTETDKKINKLEKELRLLKEKRDREFVKEFLELAKKYEGKCFKESQTGNAITYTRIEKVGNPEFWGTLHSDGSIRSSSIDTFTKLPIKLTHVYITHHNKNDYLNLIVNVNKNYNRNMMKIEVLSDFRDEWEVSTEEFESNLRMAEEFLKSANNTISCVRRI